MKMKFIIRLFLHTQGTLGRLVLTYQVKLLQFFDFYSYDNNNFVSNMTMKDQFEVLKKDEHKVIKTALVNQYRDM